jgi:hypothetical protein
MELLWWSEVEVAEVQLSELLWSLAQPSYRQ